MDRHLLKRMNAQKLAVTDAQQRPGKPCSVKSAGELELLVKDNHQEVNGDRNPDLGLHRIGARTEVVFDRRHPLRRAVEPVNIRIAGSGDGDAVGIGPINSS